MVPIENHVKFEKVKASSNAAAASTNKDEKTGQSFAVNTMKLHAALERTGVAHVAKKENGINRLRNNIRKSI